MRSGGPLLTPGYPSPLIDGITPVFLEVGASPLAGSGLPLPPGSIVKHGSDYFQKVGADALNWQALGTTIGISIGANRAAFRSERARYMWGPPIGSTSFSISTTGASVDGQQDRLRAYAEQFPADVTLTKLQCWWNCQNATAGAARFRVGLYTDNEGYPSSLLWDSGDLDLSTTGGGAQTVFTMQPDVDIEGGSNIWLAWFFNSACDGKHPTLSAYVYDMAGDPYQSPLTGWPQTALTAGKSVAGGNDDVNSTLLFSRVAGIGWAVSQAFGSMPASFPAGGAVLHDSGGSGDTQWRRWRPFYAYEIVYL